MLTGELEKLTINNIIMEVEQLLLPSRAPGALKAHKETLKQFIDVHNLPVKKNTGGVNSRTKADIYDDIVRAVHARSSASSLAAAQTA